MSPTPPTVEWCHPDSLQIREGHPQTLGPKGTSCHHVSSNHVFLFSHAMKTLQVPRLHRITWDWVHTLVSHQHGCQNHDYQQSVRAPSRIDHNKCIVKSKTKCCDTPCCIFFCCIKAAHKASQFTLSNAFERSKLMIHNGMFASNVFCRHKFAVNKCSSILLCFRKPCCSSGCEFSNASPIRPSMR